jgi:hypothetical protein
MRERRVAKKLDLDNLMNELGIDKDEAEKSRRRRSRHPVDEAEAAFSPLPAVPSGQIPSGSGTRHDDIEQTLREDPAVPVKPRESADVGIGEALADVWMPDDDEIVDRLDLGAMLVEHGVVSEERLATAEKIIKQSPGRRLEDVLIENGADEIEMTRVVALANRLEFERIDLEHEDGPQYDGTLLHRLGIEFAKDNLLMPLRRESGRVVIGTTRPDDIFLLDDVRRKLNVSAIKHVLVPAYDIRGVLELFAEEETEEVDVDDIIKDIAEDDVEVVETAEDDTDLEEQAGQSPVIRFVNYLIHDAVKERGVGHPHRAAGEAAARPPTASTASCSRR